MGIEYWDLLNMAPVVRLDGPERCKPTTTTTVPWSSPFCEDRVLFVRLASPASPSWLLLNLWNTTLHPTPLPFPPPLCSYLDTATCLTTTSNSWNELLTNNRQRTAFRVAFIVYVYLGSCTALHCTALRFWIRSIHPILRLIRSFLLFSITSSLDYNFASLSCDFDSFRHFYKFLHARCYATMLSCAVCSDYASQW
jgi:hypothetical protein